MSKAVFWWGNNNPDDMKVFGLGVLFGVALNSIALYWFADAILAGTPAIESGLNLESMRGILAVTILWIFFFFSAMGGQVAMKMGYEDNEDATHVAERSLMNTIEHAIPSLLIIWMCAIYCNATLATVLGSLYVAGRFLYPIMYGWYGQFTLLVEFATQVGYMAVGIMGTAIIGQLIWDDTVIGHFINAWYQPFCVIGCGLGFGMFFFNAIGMTVYKTVYVRGVAKKEAFDLAMANEQKIEENEGL